MLKFFSKLVCALIPNSELRVKVRNRIPVWYVEHFSGSVKKRLKKEKDKKFKHYLSIVAIAKNEAPYMAEWIEFHKLVGVDQIYLYDNDSDDNLMEVLKPYIENGDVTYIPFPGSAKQIPAYEDAVKRFKDETKWMAIVDLDEFIVPLEKDSIPEFLKDFEDQAGVVAYWLMYGDNGHKTYEPGLVIERFTAHAEDAYPSVKSIVNPREVKKANVHYCEFKCGLPVNENKEYYQKGEMGTSVKKIRINHYFGKSFEEFKQKRARGQADRLDIRSINDFENANKNDVQDNTLDKYVPLIKAELEKKFPNTVK